MTTESQHQEPIKIVKLEHPYSFGQKEIGQVEFLRRPKTKDIKGLNRNNMTTADTLRVLANITPLSTPEMEEMDLDDFALVQEALLSFLPNTQRIGSGL